MMALDRSFALVTAIGLMMVAPSAVAAETAAESPITVAADAWQGQGNGNGQGRAAGNQGNGGDDRAQAQRTRGRDTETASRGQGAGSGQRPRSGQRRQGSRPGQRRGPGSRQRPQRRRAWQRARGNENARASDNASGRSNAPGRSGAAAARRPDRPSRTDLRAHIDRMPESLRRYSTSTRASERMLLGALTLASLRGTESGRFRVDSDGSRVRVANRRDVVLLDMSEDDARNLGHWRMRRLGDQDARNRNGSPPFCTNGEGHPVHGRQWCIEKGFGLGVSDRNIWSSSRVDDVIFKRRPEANVTLDRGGLIGVLGDIVLGRLAVQSLALGYDEPLVGRWVQSDEPASPWILKVNSGNVAVAEFVDTDRDNDVDVLFVSQPRW